MPFFKLKINGIKSSLYYEQKIIIGL